METTANLPFNNFVRLKILDYARKASQLPVYKQLIKSQWSVTREEINQYQAENFKKIFIHHYNNNRIYRQFLNENNCYGGDNIKISDVPIITKAFFKANIHQHKLLKFIHTSKYSGGSTGIPMPVHLSEESVNYFWPSIWRAFDVYDIKPCDKILMIAGPSLFNNRSIKRRIYDHVSNFFVVSAFELSLERLQSTYHLIKSHDIRVIYGYTSAILVFLNFLKTHNLTLKLRTIFTTSETFIPQVRILAKEFCGCDVIDTYGANDGGVFGFECKEHSGYHLNYERCLVEVVNNKIICTDLLNTASPFIRYEVGDYTSQNQIDTNKCECGRTLFRLKSVSGRINDYVTDLDNNHIHSEFFSHVFSADTNILQFQVTEFADSIVINIVSGNCSLNKFEEKYRPILQKRFLKKIKIVANDEIIKLGNGKTPILIKNNL